MISLNS
jgi:hypothetical protein